MDRAPEEVIRLEDGTRVHVREVRPSDRPTLERGFQRLSETSRLFRFLGPRGPLTEEELRYLTDVDGVDHFALGAVTRDREGVESGVAIARFVRLADDPATADLAITVLDEYQGRGVGTFLLGRLIAAARSRGIHAFCCDVHPENEPAKRLVRSLVPEVQSHLVGSLLHFVLPLAPPPEGPVDAELG